MTQNSEIETLVASALECLAETDGAGPAAPETTMRERFFEMLVLILGNLYAKTPLASPLFDRTTMLRITTGMDDGDAGKLTGRTEDWLRLENMLRQQEGTKNYYLPRVSLAVLATITSRGTLGEVFDKILRRYQAGMPTEKLRTATRVLGSYFLTRIARG